MEWNVHIPEQYRCLFFTFSHGYPISQQQIYDFFTEYVFNVLIPIFHPAHSQIDKYHEEKKNLCF